MKAVKKRLNSWDRDENRWKRRIGLRQRIVDTHERCGGNGYLIDQTTGDDVACDCMLVFRYVAALEEASIPQDYWQLHWQTLEIGEAYKKLMELYVANFDRALQKGLGIAFIGTNGVGKTAMLAEIGKEAILRQASVRYVTNESYITATIKGGALIDEIDAADVVLLDEIEKAYIKEGSDFVPKKTEELIRRLLSRGRLLCIASNLTEDELHETFGDSTMSMLSRRLKVVAVAGEDFSSRLQKDWLKNLKMDYDYFHSALVERARQLPQEN